MTDSLSYFLFLFLQHNKINFLFLFFCFKLIFQVILDSFDVFILKINFKNKKYYFNIFINKKYFKKQSNYHILLFICTCLLYVFFLLSKLKSYMRAESVRESLSYFFTAVRNYTVAPCSLFFHHSLWCLLWFIMAYEKIQTKTELVGLTLHPHHNCSILLQDM